MCHIITVGRMVEHQIWRWLASWMEYDVTTNSQGNVGEQDTFKDCGSRQTMKIEDSGSLVMVFISHKVDDRRQKPLEEVIGLKQQPAET